MGIGNSFPIAKELEYVKVTTGHFSSTPHNLQVMVPKHSENFTIIYMIGHAIHLPVRYWFLITERQNLFQVANVEFVDKVALGQVSFCICQFSLVNYDYKLHILQHAHTHFKLLWRGKPKKLHGTKNVFIL